MHPHGIWAKDAKRLAGEQIELEFGFDPYATSNTGENPSRSDSRGDQWARNLVSNKVVDGEPEIEVGRIAPPGEHSVKAVRFPLSASNNSVPEHDAATTPSEFDDYVVAAADQRAPKASTTETKSYQRSAPLANLVRERAESLDVALSGCGLPSNRDDLLGYYGM